MIDRLCIRYFQKNGWRFVGPLPRSLGTVIIFYGPKQGIKQWILARAVIRLTGFNTKIVLPSRFWRSWRAPFLSSKLHFPLAEKDDAERLLPTSRTSKTNLAVCFPLRYENWEEDNSWMLKKAWEHSCIVLMPAYDMEKKEMKFHTHFKPSSNLSTEWAFVERFINRYN